jgi:hypothetical protein
MRRVLEEYCNYLAFAELAPPIPKIPIAARLNSTYLLLSQSCIAPFPILSNCVPVDDPFTAGVDCGQVQFGC